MALTRNLTIGVSLVLIVGRGRFELRDVGFRGFGVAVWIASDAPPVLVALSEHDWTALGPDVLVRLAPRRKPYQGGSYGAVSFEVPKEIRIIHSNEDIPIIQDEEEGQ